MTVQPSDPSQAAQRVKVGLTGLATVLLLILFASAMFRFVREERPADAAAAAKADAVANIADAALANASANEPLAQIGVAPTATSDTAPAQPQRR